MSKKILVIRFSSIGDIVLTTPVVRVLHEQLGAEVHFLTKPAFESLVLTSPHISKVITLSDDFEKMISLLRDEQYDHVVDLHHNLRSQRIKLALKKQSTSFHKLNFRKWLMVNFKINRLPDVHIVQRYLDTILFLGVRNDSKGLDLFIPPEKNVDLPGVLGMQSLSFAGIVVGAAHATKCMTADQIARLCDLLQMPVVLMGGKKEIEKGESIIAQAKNNKVVNACGRFDLLQSASIIQQSSFMISHDTGLMHIAAALKKPQVVVWGNTIPEFGMYPYYGEKDSTTLWKSFEIKGLNCRPCSKLGYEKCPKGHFKCMLDQDLNSIAIAGKSLIVKKVL